MEMNMQLRYIKNKIYLMKLIELQYKNKYQYLEDCNQILQLSFMKSLKILIKYF